MRLQIFVEDRRPEAYEILAWKAFGDSPLKSDCKKIKASWLHLVDFTTASSLLEKVKLSQEAGFDTIFFILDQEGYASEGRPATLDAFLRAFRDLCNYLKNPHEEALRHVRVVRIVSKRCLEGWLAADPQAIVESARGGEKYRPAPRQTEELTPKQALGLIHHLLRETSNKLKHRALQDLNKDAIKSRGPSIASHLDPTRARRYNRSLAYFFDMVTGPRNGCEHPCPE